MISGKIITFIIALNGINVFPFQAEAGAEVAPDINLNIDDATTKSSN